MLFFARIGLGFQFQTLGSVAGELTGQLGLNFARIGILIGLFMVPGMFLALPAGFAGRFLSDRFIVGLGRIALAAGGALASVAALGVVSIASWIMIFSGAVCGQIADRSGRHDLVLYVCMAAAIAALMMLFVQPLSVPSSRLFGLMGMAPAGVIMALTASAMKPENRAIGMGLFFTGYFLFQAPAIAGWLYDVTADPFWPILFSAALFLVTAIAAAAFRFAQQRLPLG